MNVLIIILIVVGALIAIPLIAAIFTAKEMRIEQEIQINKPVGEIYDYIKILRNSEQFNKWVMADPNMTREYVGTDGQVGFIYKWDSQNKQVGKGEQKIVKMEESKRIDYELRFIKPYEGISFGGFTLEPSGNGAKVKYIFHGPSGYMMRVMQFMLNIKKILSKDMMTTLTNLKNIMEK